MHVWLLSHNFPPETNALASRTFEHAREWAADGRSFDVLTDVPHFPEGVVYPGYPNRFGHSLVEGISVYRFPVWPFANRGRLRRSLSFASFLLSCLVFSHRIARRPDLIVASTPQPFTALAGYLLSRRYRVPLVLEVRDLWPESIAAVGAVRDGLMLRPVRQMMDFLYRRASRIVALTEAFRTAIANRGIDPARIELVGPGVRSDWLESGACPATMAALRTRHGLGDRRVVAYLGTIGMAHGVEVMLQAARLSRHPDVVYVVVGAGAGVAALERALERSPCPRFRLVPRQPRELMPSWLALSQVLVVLLKDRPVFETVIPSKLIEAMGSRKPVVLAVRGESAQLLLRSGGGLCVTPGSAEELLSACEGLLDDPERASRLAENGSRYVREHHDRRELARRFWDILGRVSG